LSSDVELLERMKKMAGFKRAGAGWVVALGEAG
jgi:hypothetical protein